MVQKIENLTKALLVDTAVKIIKQESVDQITSERVLQESCLSKGSMYHHFQDFDDLIEAALVQIFAEDSVRTLKSSLAFLLNETNVDLARERIRKMVDEQEFALTQSLSQNHLAVTYFASIRPRMQKRLAEFQELQTQLWMDIFNICKRNSWTKCDLDSRAVSIVIQSMLLGPLVDHNASTQTNSSSRISAVDFIFGKLLFSNVVAPVVRLQDGTPPILEEAEVQIEYPKLISVNGESNQELESQSSFLKIGTTTDLTLLTEPYLKMIYKIFNFEILGPEFAEEIRDLLVSNSDRPNYQDPSATPPSLNNVQQYWSTDSIVYGAIKDEKLVGFIKVTDRHEAHELDVCIIARDLRNQGLSTALTSFAILSGKSRGMKHFISKNDHLYPFRVKVMNSLGFASGTGFRKAL
jgi:AcrR family transcriptional regulator